MAKARGVPSAGRHVRHRNQASAIAVAIAVAFRKGNLGTLLHRHTE